MAKYYEILIRHTTDACPKLPEHPDFRYMEAGEYCSWECPTHQVFQKICDVAVARDRIEQLKKCPEIERITLYFGGDRKDCWEQQWGSRRWERVY